MFASLVSRVFSRRIPRIIHDHLSKGDPATAAPVTIVLEDGKAFHARATGVRCVRLSRRLIVFDWADCAPAMREREWIDAPYAIDATSILRTSSIP